MFIHVPGPTDLLIEEIACADRTNEPLNSCDRLIDQWKSLSAVQTLAEVCGVRLLYSCLTEKLWVFVNHHHSAISNEFIVCHF